MSVYQLNKFMYRLETEVAFLNAVRSDPVNAVGVFKLTQEERKALLDGDVAALYLMGVHPFLLLTLSRQGVFGVNRDNYLPRVRAAAARSTEGHGRK